MTATERVSGVFNLGTGDPYSFNEMIELISETFETTIEPDYEPIPLNNYVHHTCADITRIRNATGWELQIEFEQGVKRVCETYLIGQ